MTPPLAVRVLILLGAVAVIAAVLYLQGCP